MKTRCAQFLVLTLGINAIAGCISAGDSTGGTSAVAGTAQPRHLATPVSELPAAGICLDAAHEVAIVTLHPGIPDPRCLRVSPEQKLMVINQTESTVVVSLGRFEASVEPGAQHDFETPFGEYVAPGVHDLEVLPCCGSAIWLVGQPQ